MLGACAKRSRLIRRFIPLSLFFACLLMLLFGLASAQNLQYPPAHMDTVADDYFGTKVPDPYRWLENPDSPETQAWASAENKLTREYVDSIPAREKSKPG